MRKRDKKFRLILVAILLIFVTGIFVFIGVNRKSESRSVKYIATNFIGYDLIRAVKGDTSEVEMLIKPGSEIHDFEPSPQDIINIKNAELFVYIGGESDEWVEKLLENNDIDKNKTLKLMDLVHPKEEEIKEGMETEKKVESQIKILNFSSKKKDYDEHIWTSPANAIKLLDGIEKRIKSIDQENQAKYQENAKNYREKITKVQKDIREIVTKSEKKTLIFGDRFPFKYFVDEYGLQYYAAFPGCSDQTEASSSTIAFLIDKAKNQSTNVILKIEMTSNKLAKTIAEEVGAEVMELNAAHNISSEDFENGKTYIDIMNENAKVLEKALK